MRIVHISDLHLRHHLPGSSISAARLSRLMPSLLERAVAEIVDLQPDLFVLSGDLIDYPLDQMDNAVLRECAAADYRLILDILEPIACPRLIIYGNHDHPQVFHEIVQPKTHINVGGYRAIAFLDDEHEEHVPYRVGEDQERFQAALDDPESAPQVHVQHYIVWPERNVDYPHRYGDGRHMRDKMVASGNVRLSLSGHYHLGVPPFFDKGVWFSTIRAFGEAPHPFWVYELDGDELNWTEHSMSSEVYG